MSSRDIISVLAAASSMASGIPSSRAQIRATLSAFAGVSTKCGWTRPARARNRRTASASATASNAAHSPLPGFGRPSGEMRQTCSPEVRRGSWAVARTLSPGQSRRRPSTSRAQASIRCSQLSSRSSSCRPPMCPGSASATEVPYCSRSRSAVATSRDTWAGSVRAARLANQAPSGYSPSISRATSSASRVLPRPDAPVMVTSRACRRTAASSVSSGSRPTKLVSWTGRLLDG